VQDGDGILIDIPDRKLELLVPEEEVKKRFQGWRPLPPKITKGYLARYSKLVSSAAQGAVMLEER
ncbi:MAG: dihydroxy-acid dehydratase, partial [Candidatus Latescibacterota bacterium]